MHLIIESVNSVPADPLCEQPQLLHRHGQPEGGGEDHAGEHTLEYLVVMGGIEGWLGDFGGDAGGDDWGKCMR